MRPGFDQGLLVGDIEGAVVAPFRVDLSLDAAFFTGALPGLYDSAEG
jgi:hypothetical protein